MAYLYANNVATTLTGAVGATDTVIYVANGALFPAPTGGDVFALTMTDAATGTAKVEIGICTARTGNALTVTRAQDGTSALSFAIGDAVSMRVIAKQAADYLSKAYGGTVLSSVTYSGAVSFGGTVTLTNGGNISGLVVTGSQMANQTITATQIANQTITATQIANQTITGAQVLPHTFVASESPNDIAVGYNSGSGRVEIKVDGNSFGGTWPIIANNATNATNATTAANGVVHFNQYSTDFCQIILSNGNFAVFGTINLSGGGF